MWGWYESEDDPEPYITYACRCSSCGELLDLDDLTALDFQAERSGVEPGTPDGPAVHWAVGTIRCPNCQNRLPFETSS